MIRDGQGDLLTACAHATVNAACTARSVNTKVLAYALQNSLGTNREDGVKKTEQQHEPRRDHLLAERIFLRRDLADTPEVARLTRMSMQARLRKVEGELSVLTEGATATAQTLVADKASAGRQCTSEALDLKPRPLDPLPKNA